jgi:hypothetical protein
MNTSVAEIARNVPLRPTESDLIDPRIDFLRRMSPLALQVCVTRAYLQVVVFERGHGKE